MNFGRMFFSLGKKYANNNFIKKMLKKSCIECQVIDGFLDMNGNLRPKETFEENFDIAGTNVYVSYSMKEYVEL